ncbi:MAG: hypothetical protein HC879_20295, partial [Leptolyngbyaceae cyanobacterium SL_5_9]|nr:hypothetical protein [Leptolyngbyaceae cyanobacterium SL_5_9]
MERLISLFGLLIFIALAYVFSTNRQAVRWQPVM